MAYSRHIVPYQSAWPERFAELAGYLGRFLPEGSRVHHIGSTSIPGMPAKDIVDVHVEHQSGGLESVTAALEQAGYRHHGDQGIPGREVFKPEAAAAVAALPRHHLYASEAGAEELRRHLAFRDYLRAHPDRADWLAEQKLRADGASGSKDEYIERKADAYATIAREARGVEKPR
ncbi:MAG: GrpB family protein [Rhodothermales bacterium]|nr:GrpB family protein [Rhodothermales bacterium]MBO6780838.1 GrpB family protein [Rhodothermales bacterium]